MKWIFILLIVLIFLFLLIMFTKVSIHIDFFHGNDNDKLTILLKAWGGLIKYKKEIPMIKLDEDSPTVVIEEKTEIGPDEKKTNEQDNQFGKKDLLNSLYDTKALFEHVVGLHTHIRKLLKKVVVKKIEWHTNAGIGEASATAILCGGIWSAKGAIIGVISNYMRMVRRPILTVTPNFQQTVSRIQLKCIFQIRIGHAILAGIKLVKYWKGGMPQFKTKPLSALSGENINSV